MCHVSQRCRLCDLQHSQSERKHVGATYPPLPPPPPQILLLPAESVRALAQRLTKTMP